MLCPTLLPGQIVILDNYSIHIDSKIRELIERKGCELYFLPTYSPDLQPHRERLFQNQSPAQAESSHDSKRSLRGGQARLQRHNTTGYARLVQTLWLLSSMVSLTAIIRPFDWLR